MRRTTRALGTLLVATSLSLASSGVAAADVIESDVIAVNVGTDKKPVYQDIKDYTAGAAASSVGFFITADADGVHKTDSTKSTGSVGCDATATSPLYLTVSAPAGVVVAPQDQLSAVPAMVGEAKRLRTVRLEGCGSQNAEYVDFSTSSTFAAGDYAVGTEGYDDFGKYTNASAFTLRVAAPVRASTMTIVTCPESVAFTSAALTPCTAAVVGAGLNQSLTVTHTNNTNVGTADASAAFAGSDTHLASSDSKSFQITRASTSTTMTCSGAPFRYTGLPQTPCSAAVTGPGLDQPVNVSHSSNTDAGDAQATASYAGTSNYQPSGDSETFTINKATTTTTVTCAPGTYTYTGSEHRPCSAAVTGAGGLTASVGVTYSGNVDSGTATAAASFAQTTNHAASEGSSTFGIGKATTETTVSCSGGPFTYTGQAQTPCSASVTGPGLDQVLPIGYTDNTDAGDATATAVFTETSNYAGSGDSVEFVIGKAASTTVVTCAEGPFTYTGQAQTPCSASVSAPGLDLTPLVEYSGNVDAGTATASLVFAETSNHFGSDDSVEFVIGKAQSATLVTCAEGPFTYTGSAHTPCSASVSGAGLALVPEVSYSGNVNAGTATASLVFAETSNHFGSDDSVEFVIGKAASTTVVTCAEGPFTYTGQAQTPCSASVSAAGLDLTPQVGYSRNVDAGTATASLVFAGTANHRGSEDSVDFVIGKASSSVFINDVPSAGQVGGFLLLTYAKTGDGATSATTLTPETCTVTATGSVTFDSAGTCRLEAAIAASANYAAATGAVQSIVITDVWTSKGFFRPVDMSAGSTPTWNSIKGGNTVPLKFELFKNGVEQTSTAAVTSLKATPVACSSGSMDAIETVSAGSTALRYDSGEGVFIYNWKTPTGSGCYKMTVATPAGEVTAWFRTNK